MKATIKYIKLLEKHGEYGFEILLSTEAGNKKFGGITDKSSFRRLFFGLLSIANNNYDITALTGTKGIDVSTLIERPNTINQRIAYLGHKSKFLFSDSNKHFITKKLTFKEMKLLSYVEAIQSAKLVEMRSASGTICMLLQFKGYTQGATGPNVYIGLGYPLDTRELNAEEEEFVANYSSSYIAGLIKTILNTRYLYNEKNNDKTFEVECTIDELGNVISIGNMSDVERKSKPVYINQYDNEYILEAEPKLSNNKRLKR